MKKEKVIVLAKHIRPGIERYEGAPHLNIQKHLDNAKWQYEAYLFKDGRVLLVYGEDAFGILYASEEVLYADMENETRVDSSGLDGV